MNKDLGFNLEKWNETEAKELNTFEQLKLGGHKIVIVEAGLYKGETGNISLKVAIDIAEGDPQAGYFKKQYERNNNTDKKWSNSAIKYLSLKDDNLGYTKGFVTSLENSNESFKFDFSKDWKQIIGLKCAGVFGLEEFMGQDGIKTVTKLTGFRSLSKLNEIKIPDVKKIDGSYVNYETYKKQENSVENVKAIFGNNSIEISSEDLPF